jgi:putative ABC transport system permease protein
MIGLLRQLSWPELRHHPWRNLAALLAVMLGVALAFSVHLINASALSEFSAAVRSVNGEPDFELRAQRGGFDEALYARVAAHPDIAVASPVIEIDTYAVDTTGRRVPLRVLGLDALVAGAVSPALLPHASDDGSRYAALLPDAVFLNPAAREALGTAGDLRLQTPSGSAVLSVRGTVSAPGAALAVMDIAGAQATFGWLGRLSRIDVRLAAGADRQRVVTSLALPDGVRAAAPDEASQRVSNVSRAYRVNLTVLALVALFTGAFLVFSILSLSVAKRQAQFALLGVLGLTGRERLGLVVAESALLGAVGSGLGLLLGTALAATALKLLAGDLGGGYFPGVTPRLQFSAGAAAVYGGLGVLAAMVGGWVPARAAQRLAPALALKGLGGDSGHARPWLGPVLVALGAGLALLPPVAGVPLAAYASVACLLLGGIAWVPAGLALMLSAVRPPREALPLLAVERARHQRNAATVAVAGVVASLSLAVALTVMVASFRDAVTQWLDTVLPADLYVRAASAGGPGDLVALPAPLVNAAASLPGIVRAESQRVSPVLMDERRPPIVLIARPLTDPARELPLTGDPRPLPAGETGVYVSEAMVDLYRAAPGTRMALPLPDGSRATVFVRGVWRDYARQHGAVMMHAADYRRLTGDTRVNDLAMWLAPGADPATVQHALRAAAGGDAALLEFASPGEIRATSLRIFDRSFAVTYWLQGVAIAIGLFGIAASWSAQVLARRKEFGLLSHLGLTRRQILSVVAIEGAVWTAVGAALGLLLGIAVSVVLVKVVNPQSFHWTMDLMLPWGRLLALCAAVLFAGTVTAWLSARSAASRQMALAVKEDW